MLLFVKYAFINFLVTLSVYKQNSICWRPDNFLPFQKLLHKKRLICSYLWEQIKGSSFKQTNGGSKLISISIKSWKIFRYFGLSFYLKLYFSSCECAMLFWNENWFWDYLLIKEVEISSSFLKSKIWI